MHASNKAHGSALRMLSTLCLLSAGGALTAAPAGARADDEQYAYGAVFAGHVKLSADVVHSDRYGWIASSVVEAYQGTCSSSTQTCTGQPWVLPAWSIETWVDIYYYAGVDSSGRDRWVKCDTSGVTASYVDTGWFNAVRWLEYNGTCPHPSYLLAVGSGRIKYPSGTWTGTWTPLLQVTTNWFYSWY